MLSFEWSNTGRSEELNTSLGTYLTVDEIESAFGVKNIGRPWGVGVIQPAPSFDKKIWLLWFVFIVVLIGTFAAFSSKADPMLCFIGLFLVSTVPVGILFYLYSFEVNRWQNSDFSPYASE